MTKPSRRRRSNTKAPHLAPQARSTGASLLLLVLTWVWVPSLARAQETPAVEIRGGSPPPEMERLSFLVGRWDNRTDFVDAQGNVTGTFHLTTDLEGAEEGYVIRPALGGWILEGGSNGDFGRTWYRYDPSTERYQLLAADFRGNLDVLEGDFEEGVLTLSAVRSKPRAQGGSLRWRWVFHDIEADAYGIEQWRSIDDGAHWTLVNRQRQTRLAAPAPRATPGNMIPTLAGWLGTWRSQTQRAQDGRAFHFIYETGWYDRAETLIRFTIHQVFEDGEQRFLWEGMKGFDPERNVTFSEQYSPSGARGRGTYTAGPDGTLTVHGRGTAPDGSTFGVRDVFEPVSGERSFVTTGYLERDGEWRQMNRDVWHPVAGAGTPPGATTTAQARGFRFDSISSSGTEHRRRPPA